MSQDDKFTENLDLDDLLPQVGEFGRYQKLMLWLVCLPACFPCGFSAFNQLFMNLTQEERRNISIPYRNGTFSKCERFQVNWTEFEELPEFPDEFWPVARCEEGWEFDLDGSKSSIVIDFELVCERDIYPTLGLVALNLGGPIGVYYFGILNDKIGRKKSYFLCLTTMLLGNFLTASAQDFWWWASSRVIVGLTVPAVYQIPFIIAMELVGPNYRSFVTLTTCIFYTMGLVLLSAVTYLIHDWVYLTLATSAPFVLYYFYWFFLPESPRWLLSQGKFDQALEILENLAKTNRKSLPPSFRQQLKQRMLHKRTLSEEERMKKTPGVMRLCQTPNMRLKTILITLIWFATETVYVGLCYYGPALGNNEYLSFFLSSMVEIPSYIICYFVMDRWGRRWPLCLSTIASGFCCIATVLLPDDAVVSILVMFLVAKMTISASFLIIYPFAGELYPTQLRGIGIGFSAYIGGLGLVIIPFITYLGSENLVLPLIIMGVMSVIGGFAGLRLPETLHYKLPQTVEDGEDFGKNYTLQDCLRCIPLKPDRSPSNYEDLELDNLQNEPLDELTPLEKPSGLRKLSMHRLARQTSVIDTQKDADGNMKMTYWF